MKLIRLYLNENLIGEGGATSDEDLVPALETIAKAVKGIKGIRIEVSEGNIDDLVNDFRDRFTRTYTVKGTYTISGMTAEVSMEFKAVSEEEAIEKAKNAGVQDPYIYIECEDDYCDDDEYYDDCDDYDEYEDEDESDSKKVEIEWKY